MGPWDDLLAFVFSAGTLTQRQAGRIRLGDGELEQYEFCDQAQAHDRLNEQARRRLRAALRAAGEGTVLYLHDGQQVP
jgi:8-oxo-dGTP diphosphatase